ncbi:MAG TPA: alpha/beta hydrolase [Actinopolymorphaceae bacterium]
MGALPAQGSGRESPEVSGTLQRSGSTIRYWIGGPRRGPVVAFTHGMAMSHRVFEPQLAELWAAGYRTLRWDMRGHGRSQPMGKSPLTLRDLADDLHALLDGFLLGRHACLVGQGLGGHVAQQVVLDRPDRVAALVVVGSLCITRPGPVVWRSLVSTAVRGAWMLRPVRELHDRIGRESAVTPWVQSAAFDCAQLLDKRGILATLRAQWETIRTEPAYRIYAPVLVMHGEHDVTPGIRRSSTAWAERDPRCRYEVVRKAGHLAQLDNPKAFNARLVEFLTEYHPVPRGISS